MTAWNPQIPNPNNVPANDAIDMQQNNGVLDAAFQVDHTPLSQATNQGMHKQITFSQPPVSLPFPVMAQQSYEYERLLATNNRSYLEYQPSGPDINPIGGGAAVVPLSFKSFAMFQAVLNSVIPAINYSRRFNITSITESAVGGGQQFVVVFAEAMPDANYFIQFFYRFPPAFIDANERTQITAIANTGFTFQTLTSSLVAGTTVGFSVV